MVRSDIMALPHRDKSFDVILCNHVLEHVADDGQAVKELHRVLKPGGWGILQVPIALALGHTIEDPTASSDDERIRMFGQRDHVRLFAAADYPSRLRAGGFTVSVCDYPRTLGEIATRRYGLIPEEEIYVVSRAGA
jgi:SAM-dependent methyltransferase